LIVADESQGHGAWNTQLRAVWGHLMSRNLWGISMLAVACLFLVLTLALVVVSPGVRHQIALSFTRASDSYTELYFPGSQPVSTTAVGGQPQVRVSFVVANHENGSNQYTYQVRLLDPAGRPVAQRMGSVVVADGETRSNEVVLTQPARTTWSTVEVTLLNRPETIHYTTPEARTPGT
jgi:hypothetical protein